MRKPRKRGTQKGRMGYRRSVVIGLSCAALFLVLLLSAAVLSDWHSGIAARSAWIAKGSLLVCALICGAAAAAGADRSRFLYAIAGEGILFALLLCAVLLRGELSFPSFLTDIGFLIFGAFAGSFRKNRTGSKRRG